MPSLTQVLASHPSLLLIDAASSRIQAGIFGPGGAVRWATADDEAGVGLFGCVEELGCDLADIHAFAFCEGPGSTLGIRTTAMALRTWCVLRPRPVYAYRSLAVVVRSLDDPQVAVIADARRGHWHVQSAKDGLRRIPGLGTRADSGTVHRSWVTPEHFRHWAPLPPGTQTTPYGLASLFANPAVAGADLFTLTEDPDAFAYADPEYATWTPGIHRAPSD